MINVQACTVQELKSMLPVAYELRQPVMLWGAPGIGKSESVWQFCSETNKKLIDIRLTTLESVDLRGLPWPDKTKKETVWMRPEFMPTEDVPGVIFLDEITAAEPRLQASSYELVLDRRVGKHKLPPGWWVMAAGNGTEHGAISYGMSSALADRFLHVNVTATASGWIKWALEKGIHPSVISFIKMKPEFLTSAHGQEQEDHLVVPTPRSWERVSNVLKTTEDWNLRSIMMNGLVGESVTVDFKHTAEEIEKLPPIEDLLKWRPEEAVKKIPATIPTLYGLVYSLNAYCSSVKDLNAATKLLIALSEVNDNLPRREIQGMAMEFLLEKAVRSGKIDAFMKTEGFKQYEPYIKDYTL